MHGRCQEVRRGHAWWESVGQRWVAAASPEVAGDARETVGIGMVRRRRVVVRQQRIHGGKVLVAARGEHRGEERSWQRLVGRKGVVPGELVEADGSRNGGWRAVAGGERRRVAHWGPGGRRREARWGRRWAATGGALGPAVGGGGWHRQREIGAEGARDGGAELAPAHLQTALFRRPGGANGWRCPNLPRFHHPPPTAPPTSTGLLLRTFRRPPPAKSTPPVSNGAIGSLIPRPSSRPFAAATRLPPPAACPRSSPAAARLPPAVAPLRDLLPRTRRCRPPTGSRASTTPKILRRWAGSGTPHPRPGEPKHAVGRVHSTRHLLPRHVAAYPVITATTHCSGRDPPRSPTLSVRAVLPVCSLDSRAKSAPKSAERAPDFLCLKFSCTMETPFETLAGDVLTSCRSQSP
ncbi:uncharacterized protein [Triticum aestivum]|uniref:uncharacterized protein n=1 Tax=Triticum aestivum TaxID=4565 RepID=UPI001D012407|nr:uncharacterized protein LOC123067341 [Triticum aestivum]